MQILQTDRLILRKMSTEDASFILEMLNDPEFIKFVGDRKVRTLEDAERYIAQGPTATYESHGYGYYVVELKETGVPIGMCGLRARNGLDAPDLGYSFLSAYRGRGYATEAAAALLQYARTVLGLSTVTAICSPDHNASIAVLKKIGFSYDRDLRLPGDEVELSLFVAAPA
jgi:[ribosomal protein S5]-alanine N-acetyltransferase